MKCIIVVAGGVISCFAVGTKEGVEILNDNSFPVIGADSMLASLSIFIDFFFFVNETFSHSTKMNMGEFVLSKGRIETIIITIIVE